MDSIFSNKRNVINRDHRGETNVSIESVPPRSNSRQVIQKRGSMFQHMMENRTDFEMAIMSTLAITIPTGVILTLASSVEDAPQLSEETANFIRDMLSLSTGNDVAVNNLAAEGVELLGDSIEQLEAVSLNVIDAAFPTTATDVISIAIGEGIAASIGGFVAFCARFEVRAKELVQQQRLKGVDLDFPNSKKLGSNPTKLLSREVSVDGFIAEAVADTDYFITRAAATPLLSGIGLPPFLGVLLASIPSELIRVSARQREQRRREDELLQALLLEEQSKKEKKKQNSLLNNIPWNNQKKAVESTTVQIIDTNRANAGFANQIDFVEVFADITKWLEYDVLTNDFNGMITWNGIAVASGIESAIYGFLAALSSQLWADALYYFSDFGLKENRDFARARTVKDTLALYLAKCLSAATLFGVYESARLPISLFITNLLSGGVDSCLGSDDYYLCLETYMTENPASPSIEGQVRAFFVAVVNIIDRLNELDYNSIDDVTGIIRSLPAQFYSFFRQ